MKVLCLGAGGMGALAAEVMSGYKEIDRMTIADLHLEAAQKVAAQCRGKASACSINVDDKDALTALMKWHDAVANCVGPFFRFGVPILSCAIAARVNYFDICDDPEPTLAMLEMGKQAEAAGITAVVGLGATPGITSMLAAKVHRMLARMTELHAAWNIEEKGDDEPNVLEYSAATVHWMKQSSGRILECRGGKLTQVKPLQPVELRYPGRGTRKVWTVGHPEPVAFSWSYPEIQISSCYMVMPTLTAGIFRELSDKIDRGLLTLEQAGHQLVDKSRDPSLIERLESAFYQLLDRPRLPFLFVIGKGELQGRKATIAAAIKSFPPGMARITGIPLAIGVHQFAQNKIARKGAASPETALDADAFFAELAPYCTYPVAAPPDGILEIVQEFD